MENEIIVMMVFGYVCLGWIIWVYFAVFDYVFNENIEPELLEFMVGITFLWFLILGWIAWQAGAHAAHQRKNRKSRGVIRG